MNIEKIYRFTDHKGQQSVINLTDNQLAFHLETALGLAEENQDHVVVNRAQDAIRSLEMNLLHESEIGWFLRYLQF